MSEKYLEVRLVEAESALKVDGKVWPSSAPVPDDARVEEGYLVRRPGEGVNWEDGVRFRWHHLRLGEKQDTKTDAPQASLEMVDNFITDLEIQKSGCKTVVVSAQLMNGIELTETFTFGTPEDYNEEQGVKICLEAIQNKVRGFLDFMLWTAAMLSWD